MTKIKFGSSNIKLNRGSSAVIPRFNVGESQTISQAFQAGTEYEFTFEWTLSNVTQSGTFADGSPWVVLNGGSGTLSDVTPSPAKYNVTNNGEALTIRTNGFSINPAIEGQLDAANVSAAVSTDSKRIFDARHVSLGGLSTMTQARLDDLFDNDSWESNKASLVSNGGSGITVSSGDSIVLSLSYWDSSDTRNYNQTNSYLPYTSSNYYETGDALISRTATRYHAVLTVLAEAPASEAFRPPIHWRSGDEASKPVYLTSEMIGDSSWMSLLGHSSRGVTTKNVLDEAFSEDELLVGPIVHVGDEIAYHAAQENWRLKTNGSATYFGNSVPTILNTLLVRSCSSELSESTRELCRKKIIQYGIDSIGAMSTLGNLQSGAGQKAGELKAWAMLAWYMLGETDKRDVITWLDALHGQSWSDAEKETVLSHIFHEDLTLFEVTNDGSETDYDSIGEDIKTVSDFSLVGTETVGSVGEIPNFETFRKLDIQGSFGYVELGSRPPLQTASGTWSQDDYNFMGAVLEVETSGTTDSYEILWVSENFDDPSGIAPFEIIVDREWEVARPITSADAVRIVPFKISDVDKTYFSTLGKSASDLQQACKSLYNSRYASVSNDAWVVPYAALHRLYRESGYSLNEAGRVIQTNGYFSQFVTGGSSFYFWNNRGAFFGGADDAVLVWIGDQCVETYVSGDFRDAPSGTLLAASYGFLDSWNATNGTWSIVLGNPTDMGEIFNVFRNVTLNGNIGTFRMTAGWGYRNSYKPYAAGFNAANSSARIEVTVGNETIDFDSPGTAGANEDYLYGEQSPSFSTGDIEPGGTYGWSVGDPVKIEVYSS